jgi:hypothetical protein
LADNCVMAIDPLGGAPAAPILDPALPRPGTGSPARTGRPFIELLGEAARPPPATGPPARSAATPPAEAPAVRAMAQGALDADREIDRVLAAAASGRTFTPGELLGLQIKVFRYSQAVEIISRAADRVVGAVKQAMGTQV